jgi:hypothetical protein
MVLPNAIKESVQNQAKNVLVTGQRFKRFDQIRQRHFWSSYRFTPDQNGYLPSGDFDVFSIPMGQQGQGYNRQLTLLETNWPSANRVPDNQNFEITELGVTATYTSPQLDAGELISAAAPGIEQAVLDNTVLSITYLTNTVPLGLCSDFAQASGVRVGFYAPNMPTSYDTAGEGVSVPDGLDPTRTFYTNGFAAPGLRRRFKIPILLQHGETFRFTLQIAAGRGPAIWYPIQEQEPSIVPYIDLRVDFWATESFVEAS